MDFYLFSIDGQQRVLSVFFFSSPCYVYAVSNGVLVVCVFIWCLGSEVNFDTWMMDNVVGSFLC